MFMRRELIALFLAVKAYIGGDVVEKPLEKCPGLPGTKRRIIKTEENCVLHCMNNRMRRFERQGEMREG